MECEKPTIDVESITTKYGTARIIDGYWRITSRKEGNNMKFLHRLFFEDYHKCTLLPNAVIHHRDGNKINNRYDNLELMSAEEHLRLHKTGKNHHMWNKHHSDETKKKMSESRNSSGYFRVSKYKDNRCKQGFLWRYRYVDEDGKRKAITSVDIEKLEAKVRAKGLKWLKIENKED